MSSFSRAVASPQQLFFQNTYFIRVKILSSSHFSKMGSFLGQYFVGTATFLVEKPAQKPPKLPQNRYFFNKGTSSKEVPFRNSYFLEKANFPEKQHSALHTFSKEPLCRASIFSKDLTFHISYFFRRAFFSKNSFLEEILYFTATLFCTATY